VCADICIPCLGRNSELKLLVLGSSNRGVARGYAWARDLYSDCESKWVAWVPLRIKLHAMTVDRDPSPSWFPASYIANSYGFVTLSTLQG
jgi:hypothetical protein